MRIRLLLSLLLTLFSIGALTSGCGDDGGGGDDTDAVVEADDQQVDPPNMVVVRRVVSPGQGWISIRPLVGATPSSQVLGSAAVSEGESSAITIELDENLSDGDRVVATLHEDTGERGSFEFQAGGSLDPIVLDADGEEVRAEFQVTVVPLDQPSILVDDQTADPATRIFIRSIVSPNGPAVVTIHEDDNGSPAAGQIGSVTVPTGSTLDAEVMLQRDAVDGETLWAVLGADNDPVGQVGPEDTPLTDEFGAEIRDSFEVSVVSDVTPSVTVEDQEVNPINEVVVAEVASPGPGWIVIHEAGDPIGGIIGMAQVNNGTNTDVTVTLDRDTVDGETLYAMLHRDAGAVGDYNGDEDVPVRDENDDIIAPAFTVTHPTNVTPAIAVADQTPNPLDTVIVSEVASPGSGFLVIHSDMGGAPDAVLGNTPVGLGTSNNVEVTLNRPVADGETLWAMLHSDGDDNGMFDPAMDPPVEDGGSVVQASFVVTAIVPSVTVADQTANPATEVLVDEAVSPGPGFVVIHEDSGGSPGAVLGQSALSSGSNSSVTVTLSRDAAAGETLYAMIHVDRGMVGTYEDGVDVPAVDDMGAVVSQSFDIMGAMSGPTVSINDQTLDLTQLVTVASTNYSADGWVVIHDDNGGMPGNVLGVAGIPSGMVGNIDVELNAPLADQDVIYAMLHEDLGQTGVWEPGTDVPVMNMGMTVTDSATVTVPMGTPDVRIIADNIGTTSYNFTQQIPLVAGVIGGEAEDQTLTLAIGTRYQFSVVNPGAHPIAFRDSSDMLLLALGAANGSLESDGGIAWDDDGSGNVTFTATATLAGQLDDYICQNHSGMTGTITAQ